MFENLNINVPAGVLVAGNNVLAIHGLNVSTSSSDFLISVELVAEGGCLNTPVFFDLEPLP